MYELFFFMRTFQVALNHIQKCLKAFCAIRRKPTETSSKQSVTVDLLQPLEGNSLLIHIAIFSFFFYFFLGGQTWKCLLYTAVEAVLSVEDSWLLFDCELNEETEWGSSWPASPPNTFLDRPSSSTLPIPVQPVTQVKLTSLSLAIMWFGCSLHSSRHHLNMLLLECIQLFRH